MAMKVKGITIELNADTSGLEKALKDINKSLSQTQKDLKDVDKALKMDPKNVELVEQKQRLLAKSIDETTKKLKALKEAQDNIKDRNSESGQRQYDALTREISGAETKLRGLNQQQKQFRADASAAQFNATAFGSALTKVGSIADKVAQSTAAISAAAAGALVGLVGMVANAGQFADEMTTMSQQTGLSTDSLQKMNYAAEMVDVPLETIVSSVRKMKGHLDDSSGIFERLGVEVRDQNGEYRDIESIFYDCVAALGEMENGTERDTAAMDLFGRSADEMAGIIDDGGQNLRELGQEAQNLGIVIPEEDLKSLEEFNTQLDTMKAQLSGAAVAAALPVLQAMAPVVDVVSSGVRKFAQVLSGLNSNFVMVVTSALLVIAAISPMARIISALTRGITSFIQIIPMAISGLQMLNAAFTSFISNPYALIIVGIVAALALLAAGIYYVVDNWDTIGPAAQDACDSMASGVQSAINAVMDFGSSIKDHIQGALSDVKDAASGIGSKLSQGFSGVRSMITGIGSAFENLVANISDTVQGITSVFDKIKDEARSAGSNVINAFVGGVKSVIADVTAAFQELAKTIKGIWTQTEQDAKNAGLRTAQNYSNAYKNGSNILQPSPYSSPYSSPLGGGSPSSYSGGGGDLLGAIQSLDSSISRLGGTSSTNVNVELVGSAKNIFDTVRVQNNKLVTATGYHALA